MTKLSYFQVILLLSILFLFVRCNESTKAPRKTQKTKGIVWNSNPLNWDQFVEVDSLEDGFDANIYSAIIAPKRFSENNSLVYAYMDPEKSEKVRDTSPAIQLLKHEQYHFNITEYYARVLRKELVKNGKGKISTGKIKHWYELLDATKDNMQEKYDKESEHNENYLKQKYWELKIDDKLRQYAYYQDHDLMNYFKVAPEETSFYRHVYRGLKQNILTSYPVKKINSHYGKVYKVIRNDSMTVVSYYKNGKLFNGGYFRTAIFKIIDKGNGAIETQYLDPRENFNVDLPYCRQRITKNRNTIIYEYQDSLQNPSTYNKVHKKVYEKQKHSEKWLGAFYDTNGQPTRNEDYAFYEVKELDNKGRTITLTYLNKHKSPMLDKEYIACYTYSYNSNNRVTQQTFLDVDFNFATHLNEYNIKSKYDERGNLVKTENLDTNGKRIENKQGVCFFKYTYDLYDNETSVQLFNSKNSPVSGYYDYHQEVRLYDSIGRLTYRADYLPNYVLAFDQQKVGAKRYEYPSDSIQISYNEDVYGTLFNDDNGIAIRQNVLDKKNRIIEERFFNTEKEPVLDENGAAMFRYRYDENDNKIYSASYDQKYNLKPFANDVAITRWEYDENNKTKTTYYTTKDQLAFASQNVTYNTYKYNDRNQLIGRGYFNKKMEPALLDGVHRIEFFVDLHGNDTLVKSYGIQGDLITNTPIIRRSFNQFGNKISESYFDKNNLPTTDENNVSHFSFQYDSINRYLGYKQFDTNCLPVADKNGVFQEKQTLNPSGFIVKKEYYGADGKPVIGPSGYHLITYRMDDNDCLTQKRFFDKEGNPMANEFGIAKYTYEIAPSGLARSVKFFDANNEPFEDESGVFEYKYYESMNGLYYSGEEFDSKGNLLNPPLGE